MPKVIVGMSGGVDSSVAAYLLKKQGFDVEGVSFMLWEARYRTDFTACCSLEATTSASSTAQSLGIRHSLIDVRDSFIGKVIEPFVESYISGLTPNPCILCNRHIKFPFLLKEAEIRGAEYIATGHYARVGKSSGSATELSLLKGLDPKKDQSYVLYVLGQSDLAKIILPLGGYKKSKIREIAGTLALEAANRPESQEICFIENRNYSGFIEKLWPDACKPGPFLDKQGKVVGTHKGIFRYTIGQRKGLGISSLVPHYVINIDTEKNIVHVGESNDARAREIRVSGLNWIIPPVTSSFRASVKVRSMMEDKPADIELSDRGARVIFDEPQWAPAPGQSAVFYDGDAVLGGGTIESCVQPDY